MKKLKLLLLVILLILTGCNELCPEQITEISQEINIQEEITTQGEIIIPEHIHSLIELVKDPTCTNTGEVIIACEECGEIISTTIIPIINHIPGELIIAQEACINQNQISRVRCTICNNIIEEQIITYNQLIAEECNNKGYSGRIVVPELNINTPFILVPIENYSLEYTQIIVDDIDTAVFFEYYIALDNHIWFLADHSNQGFDKFYSVVINKTIAYLVWSDRTIKYICIESKEGINYRGIYFKDNTSPGKLYLSENYNDRFAVYTCLPYSPNGKYIQICVFDRVG